MKTAYESASPVRKTHAGQGRMLTVKKRDGARLIPVRDILYAESFGRKVLLHLTDGTEIEYYEKIGDLEAVLGAVFYRTHRSFLVNLYAVTTYGRSEVRIRGGGTALLSKYKYAGFVRAHANVCSDILPKAL